jgi:predicted RNase H-like HicB family nuclease
VVGRRVDSINVVRMATISRDPLNLTIHFEDAGDGWILATIAEGSGCDQSGRSRAEARANVIDALKTVLTDDQLSGTGASSNDERLTLTVAE